MPGAVAAGRCRKRQRVPLDAASVRERPANPFAGRSHFVLDRSICVVGAGRDHACESGRYFCRRSDSIQACGDVVALSPSARDSVISARSGPLPGAGSESCLSARCKRRWRFDANGSPLFSAASTSRVTRLASSRVRTSSRRNRSTSSMSIRIARPAAARSSLPVPRSPCAQRRSSSSLVPSSCMGLSIAMGGERRGQTRGPTVRVLRIPSVDRSAAAGRRAEPQAKRRTSNGRRHSLL
jgi:hypothetical protein